MTQLHHFPQDQEGFESLFRAHYEAMVGFATNYTNGIDNAEEIVQEVFANLWEKASSIEINSSIKSYLFGCVRNACLNEIKHQKVVRLYHENVQYGGEKYDSYDPLIFDELSQKINASIGRIPEKCRNIFLMSRLEGKKYAEIATELNISVKTVENQMGKALRILREDLAHYISILVLLICHGGNF